MDGGLRVSETKVSVAWRDWVCVCLLHPQLTHVFTTPPACPPAASQTRAEGVCCMDTAGGQADKQSLWFGPDGRIIHHLVLLAGNPAKMTGI